MQKLLIISLLFFARHLNAMEVPGTGAGPDLEAAAIPAPDDDLDELTWRQELVRHVLFYSSMGIMIGGIVGMFYWLNNDHRDFNKSPVYALLGCSIVCVFISTVMHCRGEL